MIVYHSDIYRAAARLGASYLARYLSRLDEVILSERDEWTWKGRLLREAFMPRAVVILMARLRRRGVRVAEGEGPMRLTDRRHRERFLRGLVTTVEAACERMDKSMLIRLRHTSPRSCAHRFGG